MAGVHHAGAGEEKVGCLGEEFRFLGGDVALRGAGGDDDRIGGAEDHGGSGFGRAKPGQFRGSRRAG